MSKNIAKRTKYQAIFQGVGSIGAAFTSALAMKIIGGAQNMMDPAAWRRVAIIFAIIATVGFEISTLAVRNLDVYDPNAKEKAEAARRKAEAEKIPLKERMAFQSPFFRFLL